MKFSQLLFAIALLSFASSASAIRCKSKLALTGDSMYKFQKVCGLPDFIDKRAAYTSNSLSSRRIGRAHRSQGKANSDITNFINQRSSHLRSLKSNDYVRDNVYNDRDNHHREVELRHETVREIQIEEWIYNFGPRRLIQKVTFIDGIAVRIESQGYGY